MNSNIHDRLKKKLKKKLNSSSDEPPGSLEGTNILEMLAQVNSILKSNPEMISKVNNCVSKIMGNASLMNKISSEIQSDVQEDGQALDNSSPVESVTALVNESTQ